MSEETSEGVKCKNCSERVPLGKFCKECGGKLDVETDGGINDGPHPPIQASDATSSEVNSKASSQLINNTSTNISETTINSVDTYQKSTSTGSTSTVTVASYADALKSPSPQQNQQSTLSGNITTEFLTGILSEPSWDKRDQPNARPNANERSSHNLGHSQAGGATSENTLREVSVYHRYS